MTRPTPFILATVFAIVAFSLACSHAHQAPQMAPEIKPVDPSHFIPEALVGEVSQEERTLSNGTKVLCYVIQTYSKPHEHEMGPWAPKSITDGKDAGGIWLDGGEVYDVDGPFVKNVATFYDDPEWKLYREDGSVRVTDTLEAFEAAARPDVDPLYNNYVVEGQPEWVADKVTTYVLPVNPIFLDEPILLGGGDNGGRNGPPPHRSSNNSDHDHPPHELGQPPHGGGNNVAGAGQGGVGLAFNGVNFDPPAPVDAILAAHTLAPFDDAGGHINPHEGYHYHAATGHTKEIAQDDGHSPMIGYVLDGFGLYAYLDTEGNPPIDLDECGGHTDEKRGYHYHVGSAGSNQIIKAFRGVPGTVTVED